MSENNENVNDNPFDGMDEEEFPFEDFEAETTISGGSVSGGRRRSGNRSFWVAVGILAAVFVVVVIILTVIAFYIVPQNRQARLEEAALINAHNTATSLAATDLAYLQTQQAIPTATQPAEVIEATATPVVVIASATPVLEAEATEEAGIGGPLDDPARTATIAALLTQAANGGTPLATVEGGVAASPTALPQTGFADDTNWPMLAGLALALVVVIFLARRMRMSMSS